MAITRHSLTPGDTGAITPTTITTSVTVPAGSDRLLLVVVAQESSADGSAQVSGVTFGGVALTRLGEAADATWAHAEIWYLKNPTVSTANVVTTFTTGDAGKHGCYVFSGVDQTTTFRTVQTVSGTATSATRTVPSVVSGDYCVDSLAIDGTGHSVTPGADQTEEYESAINSAFTAVSSTQPGSAGGVMSHTWTSSADYSFVATALIPASAGGTTFDITPGGSITPVGTLAKQASKSWGGTITPGGTLAKLASKLWGGSSTPTGTLAKQTAKPLAGAITPTGALSTVKVVLLALAGAITPTGSLGKLASKSFGGSVTPAGAITRAVSKLLSGQTTPTGTITKAVSKTFSGSVTPAGTLAAIKVVLRSFAGAIAPAGTLTRQPQKGLSGSIAPAGSLIRAVSKLLAGGITPQGGLQKRVDKALAGSIAPSGSLVTQIVDLSQAIAVLGRTAISDVASFFVGLSDLFTFGRSVSDDTGPGPDLTDTPEE